MKTSREIAEKTAWKLAKAQHSALRKKETEMVVVNGPKIDYLFWDNCHVPLVETFNQEIPLTQLIEVARAAKKSHCADPAFTYQDVELIQALDSLKQTGKADWL